jgi:hypothetical protein
MDYLDSLLEETKEDESSQANIDYGLDFDLDDETESYSKYLLKSFKMT